MALLTKSMGIITPLVLSIVVVVAWRLISYKEGHWIVLYKEKTADCIVQSVWIRSVSYMGFSERRREDVKKKSSPMFLHDR